MEFTEVQAFLEEHKADTDVAAYLKGMNPLQGISADTAHALVETNAVLKGYRDSHTSKAMNTFEENFKNEKLPGLVLEKYNEEHPPETEQQKEMSQLRLDITSEKSARVRSEMKALAMTLATEQSLPVKLVTHFTGEDEEKTRTSVADFKTEWDKAVAEEVEKRLKLNTRDPNDNDINQSAGNNPFLRGDHYNLQEQGQLKKHNPKLYSKYRSEAGL